MFFPCMAAQIAQRLYIPHYCFHAFRKLHVLSTGSVPFGCYMSFPLVLFPSDVTCPLLWFCSLRKFCRSLLQQFPAYSFRFFPGTDPVHIYIFICFFHKTAEGFPGPISTKVSIPCAIIALMLCSQRTEELTCLTRS